MTMTETTPRYSIEMAVRFWDESSEEHIEEVSGEREAAKLMRTLRAGGAKPEVVTREHFEPPPWTVDRRTQERLDREYVEATVELLAEEEIILRDACDKLRLIATGLVHPADVRTRTEEDRTVVRLAETGVRVEDECLLATWLERAANLHTACAEIRDCVAEKADSDDETLDAEFEHHLQVLANLADHSGNEYGCTKCSVVAPAKAAEVAA